MKMQELIGEFRREMPKLDGYTKQAACQAGKMRALFNDFDKCETQVAKDSLVNAVRAAMKDFADAFVNLEVGVEHLAKLNAEYTRVLGPRPKAQRPEVEPA